LKKLRVFFSFSIALFFSLSLSPSFSLSFSLSLTPLHSTTSWTRSYLGSRLPVRRVRERPRKKGPWHEMMAAVAAGGDAICPPPMPPPPSFAPLAARPWGISVRVRARGDRAGGWRAQSEPERHWVCPGRPSCGPPRGGLAFLFSSKFRREARRARKRREESEKIESSLLHFPRTRQNKKRHALSLPAPLSAAASSGGGLSSAAPTRRRLSSPPSTPEAAKARTAGRGVQGR
jgi:hypothetical protein